jgi:nucleotide-binding universal stress UspA family protein
MAPVILAYDGSDLAAYAIERAAAELVPGREAVVVCVWQTGDVGFTPTDGKPFHAAAGDEVQAAAEATAAHGAALAEAAGFRARGVAVNGAPTWEGLVAAAEEHGATLIVLGSHHRSGLLGHLSGSVAAATVSHFGAGVLVVHRPE